MSEKDKFKRYYDIPIKIFFDLADVKVNIQDLLTWKKGYIIESSKMAGEYINIEIENQPLGSGEVIVLDNKFAIRITNVYTKEDIMELSVK